MKKGIMRPGHIQIRVLNMQEALAHYRDLIGLIETDIDSQGRVYLKGWAEYDKYSVILREAEEPGMDFMGFKVLDESVLDKLSKDIQAFGCQVEELPPGELLGCGRRIRFVSPTGHTFELYATKEQVGRWGLSTHNPEAWPIGLKGMGAERFDHCLLSGDDTDNNFLLFRDVLGFDLAEQVVDENGNQMAQFLTVSMKAHDVAFLKGPEKNKLHHVSFHLETWDDIIKAADLISMTDTSLDMGPTRHGITHGKTIYFFDPSGNRDEVFADGNVFYPDSPPITWDLDQLGKGIFYHTRKLNEAFLKVFT